MKNSFKTLLKTSFAAGALFLGSKAWAAQYISSSGNVVATTGDVVLTPGKYASNQLTGALTAGNLTLVKGRYEFESNGAVTIAKLILQDGAHVVFKGNGDVTLTASELPSGQKATIEFDNSGAVTWTANPTKTSPSQHIIFGSSCTGCTGAATAVDSILTIKNLDFTFTTGPVQPYLYSKDTAVAYAVDATARIYFAK